MCIDWLLKTGRNKCCGGLEAKYPLDGPCVVVHLVVVAGGEVEVEQDDRKAGGGAPTQHRMKNCTLYSLHPFPR